MENKDLMPNSRLYDPSKLFFLLRLLQYSSVYEFYLHISEAV